MLVPHLQKAPYFLCYIYVDKFCFVTYHFQNNNGQLSHLTAPDEGDAVSLGQDPAAHLEADTEAGVEEAEEDTRPEAALPW